MGGFFQEQITAAGDRGKIEAFIPGPARFCGDGEQRDAEIVISPRGSRKPQRHIVEVAPEVLQPAIITAQPISSIWNCSARSEKAVHRLFRCSTAHLQYAWAPPQNRRFTAGNRSRLHDKRTGLPPDSRGKPQLATAVC
ncbi:MAG: hypothetical protein OET44_11240 [Gammaproteobacteria bacterium]|nr:hypothetical protein [Gammaproteobacteria bacterium]